MRRFVLLGLLTVMTVPAFAAKRVTVSELLQSVTDAAAAHKPDAAIVRQIDGMELTERLSDLTLDRLNAQLSLSPPVALALALQADQSAFLDLPRNEQSSTLAPDQTEQLRIFDSAGRYVAETLPHLPDLLATRITNRYDDSPQAVTQGSWPVRAGLHLVDRSSHEISVRGEQDNQLANKGSALWEEQRGLTSWGEFGSVLGMILADSLNGKVSWGHWEQMGPVQAAVFGYSVPKPASHFQVVSSLRRQASVEGFASHIDGSRIAGIATRANNNSAGNSAVHETRGYHGSLWIDPATGTILRITIQADSKGSSSFQRADMLVEYGPVRIADSSFICPVRSLALSKTVLNAEASTGNAPSEWLNETLFTDYHRFAATTRILDAAQPQK
jgi:hypothetical protein